MQPLRDILRAQGSNRHGGYRGRIIGIVAIVGLLFTACETAPPPGSSGGYNLTTPSVVGNLGSYRLETVSSPGIESYRSDLQAVASEAERHRRPRSSSTANSARRSQLNTG